uniref:dual specificity protein phosphatase 15 isoform X3 n=1 Tax=Ictidomys tridecemlineatus TaxID=43179 RepID=UPI001A9FFC82|nr:dual specificity protein phosphatase 15 isoform X3 [Ictidomys tridecemlineatus]
MGNGMTKVGGRRPRIPHLAVSSPSGRPPAATRYFLDSTSETSLMPKTRISWAGIRSHTSSLFMSHPSLFCRISPTFASRWLTPPKYPCISRSTTIVTAYVMTVTGLGWREVLEAIKATRPIANPNPGFRQQLEEFGWGNSRKLRRQLEERFGESPFRDEEDVRALLPLCKRCRQGSAASAASAAPTPPHSSASEGTLQRLVPRTTRDAHRSLPLLARVKQTFSCLPRCLSRKGGK